FFLYKHFYHLFIGAFLRVSDHVVVQTKWMQLAVKERKWVFDGNVHVMKPGSFFGHSKRGAPEKLINGEYIFYPASAMPHKNHILLARALNKIKSNEELKLVVTIHRGENKEFDKIVARHDLQDKVCYIGYQESLSMESLYFYARAIVFPSKLETYGLPLIEAASMGKYLIVADMDYSREVLQGYESVIFCNPDDEKQWALAWTLLSACHFCVLDLRFLIVQIGMIFLI
uniref:glycosyltransferase n=1 Tax=Chromobacterium haemolyticum TaxID=394935 RepID=UPI0013B3AD0C